MPVLTQQTDRVCVLHARVLACWTVRVRVGTVAALTLGLGKSVFRRMCKGQISSLQRREEDEFLFRLEEIIQDLRGLSRLSEQSLFEPTRRASWVDTSSPTNMGLLRVIIWKRKNWKYDMWYWAEMKTNIGFCTSATMERSSEGCSLEQRIFKLNTHNTLNSFTFCIYCWPILVDIAESCCFSRVCVACNSILNHSAVCWLNFAIAPVYFFVHYILGEKIWFMQALVFFRSWQLANSFYHCPLDCCRPWTARCLDRLPSDL